MQLVKVQQSTQHGKARHRTALRCAELAMRGAAEVSCRARQGTVLHGAALLSYSSAAVGCWVELTAEMMSHAEISAEIW